MKKKLIVLASILSTIIMTNSTPVLASEKENNNIKISIDGNNIESDLSPLIIEDRVYVPIRPIYDGLGISYTWFEDETGKHISAASGNKVVIFTIGQNFYHYSIESDSNLYTESIDGKPQIINDRTYIPARYVAEAFNYEVIWDAGANTVRINSPDRKDEIMQNMDDLATPYKVHYDTVIEIDDSRLSNAYCNVDLRFYDANDNIIPCAGTENITIYDTNGSILYNGIYDFTSSNFTYYKEYCYITFKIPVKNIKYGSSSIGYLSGRVDLKNGHHLYHEATVTNIPYHQQTTSSNIM